MDMEIGERLATQFLDSISNKYGLPQLTFEDGSCIISFNSDNLMILYPQLEGLHSIIVSIPVGVLPLAGPEANAFMREMLNGNDAWSMTCGATLGMDKTNGSVSLWYRFVLPADSEEEIFDMVEAMLGAADLWRDILKQHGGQPAFGSIEAGQEADPGMMRV